MPAPARTEPRQRWRDALHGRSRRLPVRGLLELVAELAIVLLAAVVYAVVREATEGDVDTALVNAERLYELEVALGVAWEQSLQQFVLGSESMRDVANWIYIWGHWPVITACAVALYTLRRAHYRFLRTAVIGSGLIGFGFFALVPMAPPRLADAGFVDTVTTWSTSYRTFQPPDYTNLYAAMPSLHFGWNLLVGIVLFMSTGLLLVRVFAVLMPAAMAFAVVATANHWVLDVVVGLVVVLAGLLVSHRLHGMPPVHRRERRRPPAARRSGRPLRRHAPARVARRAARRLTRRQA